MRDRRARISKRLLSICLTYPQPLTVGRGRGRPAGSVRVNTLTRRELLAFNRILGKLRVCGRRRERDCARKGSS